MKTLSLLVCAVLPLSVRAGVPWPGTPDSAHVAAPRADQRMIFRSHRGTQQILLADASGGSGLRTDAAVSGALSGWLMWQPALIGTLGGAETSRRTYRISFGAGLRLTRLHGAQQEAFEGRKNAEGQTLLISDPRFTALNVAVQIRYRVVGNPIKHPLTLGFNIDLAGVSFGPVRQAAAGVDVRPVRTNLLLGNKNDRGTLNSELYLSYKATPRLTARAGWAHIASGYALDGNRYQRFSNLAFVGLTYGIGGVWRYY